MVVEKNDIDSGKDDGFFDNSVDMLSDDYLETILSEGEGWGIVEKHMINFSPDRYFLVVGASRIEKTETYERTEVQVFIFKGFKKQGYVHRKSDTNWRTGNNFMTGKTEFKNTGGLKNGKQSK